MTMLVRSRTNCPKLSPRPFIFNRQPSIPRSYSTSTNEKEVERIDSLINLNQRLRASFAPSTLVPKPLPRFTQGYWADRKTSSVLSSSSPNQQQNGQTTTIDLPKQTTMEKSYLQVELPFKDDPALHEQYIGGGVSVRTGRLMEDLDTLAGSVAYMHCMPDAPLENVRLEATKHGIYIVTAAVDRIDMLRPIKIDEPENMRLSGLVSYTGRTSLEVTIFMESLDKGAENPETILVARFTMAVRNAKTGKSHPIPQLVIENADQQSLSDLGADQKERKIALQSSSLRISPPNKHEMEMLHKIWMEDPEGVLESKNRYSNDRGVVWMRDARNRSCSMVHPQERNVHGKAFGGYLMRLAYESAWSLGMTFARSRVSFLALDELAFKAPVDIGSLLILDTSISFVPLQKGKHHSFQVTVNASTVDLKTFEERETNTFEFTFASERPLERYVLPKSYREGMQWLAAYRRRERGQAIRRLYGI